MSVCSMPFLQVTLAKAGDTAQLEVSSVALMSSDKNVLVVRFQAGITTDGMLEPTMSLVVPVSQYKYQYTFSVSIRSQVLHQYT